MADPGPSPNSQSDRQAHTLRSEAPSLTLYGRRTPPLADTEMGQPTASPRPQQRRQHPLGSHPFHSPAEKVWERV